jgi:CheY-like chemotaxis protein
MNILIVDDEKKNVSLIEALLVPQGYKIMTAYTGEDALETLKTEKIDIVLLDVLMPGISMPDNKRKI